VVGVVEDAVPLFVSLALGVCCGTMVVERHFFPIDVFLAWCLLGWDWAALVLTDDL
jgi:hypothetical protein